MCFEYIKETTLLPLLNNKDIQVDDLFSSPCERSKQGGSKFNTHTPVYGVKEFFCLSVCLPVCGDFQFNCFLWSKNNTFKLQLKVTWQNQFCVSFIISSSISKEQVFALYFKSVQAQIEPCLANQIVQFMESIQQDIFPYIKSLVLDKSNFC